ncbi:MAG: chitobiase/beta-hexosaminidase C-terminal domain-containing protein [Paludibacteraceae bacterium]|nr:chitobiase/beta-hexosaminidase C-terminal domain-containing protein [Paludibacteraceae bacterium]
MKKKLHFLWVLLVAMLLIPGQLDAQILSENFDNLESGVPTGWTVAGDAGSYNWQVTGSSYPGYNDTKGLYFNSYYASNGATAVLKSPVFSLKDVAKTQMLKVACHMTDDGSKASFKICISTDGGATYGTVLQTVTYSGGWQEFEISLANYAGKENLSIVFDNVGGWYGRHIIDNFEISPAPTCAKATDLAISDVDQTSATFSWKLEQGKGAAATQYFIEVYELGEEEPLLDETVTPTVADGVYSYDVEDELEAGKGYYFTVKGICGADDEAKVAQSGTFYTLCDPFVLPLELDTVTETALQPCWTMNDADYLSNTVYLNSANTFFATPVLNHAANDIEVSLRYAGTSVGKGFYYGIANADGSGFDTLGYVTHTATYSERKISVNTAGTKYGNATGKVFAIRPDNYMYIYGINVHAKPCCPRVEQVTAAALDSASIQVSWLGTAASYNITLVDTTTNTTINRTATTNPVTLGDLAPQTSYLVLVQAVCGDCSSAMSDSIFVSTLCGVGDANLNESFEYEELGSVMPECWIQSKKDAWIVNHSISYYDTPNNAADGHSAIYMYYYGVEKGKTATFSPQPFNVATPGQYDVKFAMYRYSKQYSSVEGDGSLTVWANNSPSIEGATKVCEIDRYYEFAPAEKAAGWYYYDFNIPTITGTVYLIFEGKSNAINNLYLDHIQVYPAPTCRKVRNIAIDDANITTTAVPVKWEAAEGTSQWVVEYQVLAGETVVKSDSILTSNNPFTIEGLNPSTAYKVTGTVTTYCDEANRGEEIAFSFDVQTKCEALSTFPYFEGFENQFPPICWDMKNTAGNVDFVWKKYDSKQYVYEGTYAAYWTYKSSGSKAILVTPEFVFEDDKDYRIEFFAFRGTSGTSYAGEGFGVYLSETPTVTEESELLAFIPRLTSESSDKGILSVPTVSAQGMYQYKIDFNTADYTGKYIIFEAVTNNGYYQSFDNLWIGEKPSIDIIAKFNVDSVVIDAARITIPDETVAIFDIVYGAKSFDPATEGTIIDSIEGRVYSLTGLTPDYEYDVYVRARNAAGQVSAWSRNPMSFRTLCSAAEITDSSIFVENFDEYEANSTFMGCLVHNYSGSYSFKVGTEMSVYNNDTWEYDYVYAKTGSKMAMINSSNGAWMFRAVSLKAGVNYSISVDAVEWSSYYDAKLSMGVASAPDRNAVTKCLDSYILPDRAAWERVTGYFTVPADGIYYVGVGAEYGSSAVGIDSLVIRTEAVIPPAVNITALTDNSVSFALTSNAYSWELYYATAKFNPDTINPSLFTSVEELTHTINGLASNTVYYYAFRSLTEEGDASSWTSVGSFQTECGAVELPLAQGFESAAPSCWTITGDGEVGLRAYNKQEGSYSWNISGNKKLISPRVNGDLSNCEGSFWAAGQYEGERYTPKFIIGVMTNPQDPSTFKAVTDTISVNYLVADGQLQEFKFSLEGLKEDAQYKDAKYFVFEHIQGYTFLDALTVETIPSCPKPDSLVATDVTAHTITLDWATGKANETSWSILVKQGNDTVKALVANAHPYVVNGLTGNTTYSFELRALCADNDSSNVVTLKNITTACDIYTIPYTNALNGIPACWTVEDNNANDYWTWTGGSGLTQLNTSMADSYACDTARLFSPEFNISSKAILFIDMYTYYEAGTFNILFDNGTTRDTIVANYQHHNDWDTVQYDLSEYKGQTGRFVFEGYGPTQTGWAAYWYIRNFQITEVVEAPATPSIQYGGGYFTSDMLQVVVNTTETRPSYILVTMDGSEPSFEGVMAGTTAPLPSGQPIQLTDSKVIKARGFLLTADGQPYQTAEGAYLYSDVVTATFTKVALPATPVFNPAAGEYFDSVTVSIACATENVMVKYEFGGTEPTGRSATYTEPFKLTSTTVVSAIAFLTDAEGAPIMDVEEMPIASLAAFAEYKVTPYVAPEAPAVPTIQYGGGYFTSDMLQVVVNTTEARPSYILVTIDGSEPSFEGVMSGATLPAAPGQPIQLTATTTVKVRGLLVDTSTGQPYQNPDGSYVYSEVASATFTKVEAPAAPVFTPVAGEYNDSVIVSIACATENVMVKYEFGGTEPTGRSATYTEPFKLTSTTVVSAMAFLTDADGAPIMDVEEMPIASAVTFAEYKVKETIVVANPTFNPAPGEYLDKETLNVTLTCSTPDAKIYWTYGTDASVNHYSFEYEREIAVDAKNNTISAIAIVFDDNAKVIAKSEVVYATYTLKEKEVKPIEINFTPAPGEYEGSVNVTIEYLNVPDGGMCMYSIDGTDPMREYKSTTTITLTETTTVKARVLISMSPSFQFSETVEAVYTIKPAQPEYEAPAAPVFSPEAGEYVDSVAVSMTCETENAIILYDVLGLTPNFTSPRFEGEPIIIKETTTIAAIAVLVDAEGEVILNADEMPYMSDVVTATYVVEPSEGVDVDNVELVAVVYAKGGMVYVDTELGNMIEVFTVQGQCIYSAQATAELTTIDAFNADVLLVRVNGQTIKVAIK